MELELSSPTREVQTCDSIMFQVEELDPMILPSVVIIPRRTSKKHNLFRKYRSQLFLFSIAVSISLSLIVLLPVSRRASKSQVGNEVERTGNMINSTSEHTNDGLISTDYSSLFPESLGALDTIRPVYDLPVPEFDLPYFWHIPKSGGTTMKHILASCFRRMRVQKKHDPESLAVFTDEKNRFSNYINVGIQSPPKINKAVKMGITNFLSNYTDVVLVSPFVQEISRQIFTMDRRGRIFTLIRHPIEREVSSFHYLATADWESNYNPELQNMSLLEYTRSHFIENNIMTKLLTNYKEEDGPMTQKHVELAMAVLKEKILVGLTEQMDESVHRFMKYFGWDKNQNVKRIDNCLDRDLSSPKNVNPQKYIHITEGTLEWNELMDINSFDMQIYNFAKIVYQHQGSVIFETD